MKTFSRKFFQKHGAVGGRKSKRKLTKKQARLMVAAREEKRRQNA